MYAKPDFAGEKESIKVQVHCQISQETVQEWKYANEFVLLNIAQLLQKPGLLNIIVFVYQISCLFSMNTKPHKACKNSCEFM